MQPHIKLLHVLIMCRVVVDALNTILIVVVSVVCHNVELIIVLINKICCVVKEQCLLKISLYTYNNLRHRAEQKRFLQHLSYKSFYLVGLTMTILLRKNQLTNFIVIQCYNEEDLITEKPVPEISFGLLKILRK